MIRANPKGLCPLQCRVKMHSMSNPNQKVHDFLKHNPLGIVSTVSGDGKPWGAAVYFIADDAFNIYFVTRAETAKYKNIQQSRIAAFTVADRSTQTTVQLTGEVSEVPADEYMNNLFEEFMKLRHNDDHTWSPPINKVHAGAFMPLRIKPTSLHYADYSQHKEPLANYIEQII